MKASAVHVNFAKAVPRTIWYRSDVLPVVVGAVFSLVLLSLSYISLQPPLANIKQQDTVLKAAHARLSDGSKKLETQLLAIQDTQKNSGSILTARQSGLLVAQQIVTLGNSLGKDGVASRINSKGEIAGVAFSFAALSKIWNRLGPGYAVTTADPTTDGSVSFTIEPVTAVVTPAPITPANTAQGGPAVPAPLPATNGQIRPTAVVAPVVNR